MQFHAWGFANRDVAFNPRTGRGRWVKYAGAHKTDTPVSGFATLERSVFGRRYAFAVYRTDEGVVFNGKGRVWRLDDPTVKLVHDHPRSIVARLRVFKSSEVVLSFRYITMFRRLLAVIDPTYDAIDREEAFFLEFVAETACSPRWQEQVGNKWTPVR